MSQPIRWKDKWTFTVTHPESGRSQDVTIPGADRLEKQRLDNLVAWQVEDTLKELKGPNRPSVKPSRQGQHDLGKHLKEIEESKKRVRETGHGKYF